MYLCELEASALKVPGQLMIYSDTPSYKGKNE